MNSPVVPITLIVVLLIGAILFVVLSSRDQERPGPDSRPQPRHSSPDETMPVRRPPQRRRRRQRQGVLASLRRPAATREQARGSDPDDSAGPAPRTSGPPAAPTQFDGPALLGDAAAPTAPAPTTSVPTAPVPTAPVPPAPPASVRASHADAATTAYPAPPPYRAPAPGSGPDGPVDPAATTRVTPLVNATADATVRVEGDHRQQSRGPDATGWMPPLVGPPPPVIPVPESGRARPAVDQPAAGGPARGEDLPAGTAGYGTPGSPPGTGAGSPADAQAGGYPDAGPGAARSHGGRPDAPRDDHGVPAESGWTLPPTAPIPPPPAPGGEQLVANEPDVSTSAPLRLAAAGRTRRGKRGGPNEDAFVVVDGLLAVADGVGGEAAGQIASTLAVTTVASFRPQYAADPRDGLRRALERANRTVREKPLEEPSWHGMACTLDVVVLGRQQDTGRTLFVAHVGDSSVWLQPGRGRPRQLTTPHAIKNGPLLNAIGLNEDVELDLLEEPVRAGDRVVLASDGITKVMAPEQLNGLLMELGSLSPERAADALVDAAMHAGARDDTTIVVADLVADDTSTR
ncbi:MULTISPECIES: protein phosphatase 2C domain-containing protein [unclassified Frankia]|uniref:protein phosphatase 2C domain-containing protein n=1 Tax=unclassified Frankia TaxID=2632575 RepID=UPI002025703A